VAADKTGDGSLPDLDARLGALRSRTRREILALVWDRELAAGDIAAAFALTQATISEHLAVLRTAGLVRMNRVGTSRRYRARPEALTGLHGALEGTTKWQPATDIPERALADTATRPVVIARVDLPTPPDTTFRAFTDPTLYSRWLQVPVTIDDGHFAATLEWGTEVRGRYELVVPPHLIVMSWDFEDDNVPVPGHPLTGYLRIHPQDGGSHVEVHQLTENADEATFMEAAWGMVLGRLKTNLLAVTDPTAAASAKPPRPKRASGGTAALRDESGSRGHTAS
jgi:DNA-binding transcriptional ArsR family regulator